ncbi:MAG: hypothetical protein R3E68_22780 [Burkholderiaceae bacterium]
MNCSAKFNDDRFLYFCAGRYVTDVWIAYNLLRGRVGRALIAIRDHPVAAAAMGVNLPIFKSLTFGVSAAFTGIAGALGGIAVGFVAEDGFRVGCRRSPFWSAWSSAAWRRL